MMRALGVVVIVFAAYALTFVLFRPGQEADETLMASVTASNPADAVANPDPAQDAPAGRGSGITAEPTPSGSELPESGVPTESAAPGSSVPDSVSETSARAALGASWELDYARALEALDAGEPAEALRLLRRVLSDPETPRDVRVKARVNLVRACLDLDQPQRALQAAQQALRDAPESAEAWHVLGRSLLCLRRTEEALHAFMEALDRDPHHVFAANNLGYIWILRGEFAKAREFLESGLRAARIRGVEPPAVLLNNLGVARERTGDLAGAREAYAQAARAGHPTAGLGLARVLEHLESQAGAPSLASGEPTVPDSRAETGTRDEKP
jgi:Flp pilus assembly protein TadD